MHLLIWKLKWLRGLSHTFSLKLIAEALSDLVHVHNQSEFQLCWCCPASLCLLKVCTWFTAVIYAQKVLR